MKLEINVSRNARDKIVSLGNRIKTLRRKMSSRIDLTNNKDDPELVKMGKELQTLQTQLRPLLDKHRSHSA